MPPGAQGAGSREDSPSPGPPGSPLPPRPPPGPGGLLLTAGEPGGALRPTRLSGGAAGTRTYALDGRDLIYRSTGRRHLPRLLVTPASPEGASLQAASAEVAEYFNTIFGPALPKVSEDRYYSFLADEKLHTRWTFEELVEIVDLAHKYGYNMTVVADRLTHRRCSPTSCLEALLLYYRIARPRDSLSLYYQASSDRMTLTKVPERCGMPFQDEITYNKSWGRIRPLITMDGSPIIAHPTPRPLTVWSNPLILSQPDESKLWPRGRPSPAGDAPVIPEEEPAGDVVSELAARLLQRSGEPCPRTPERPADPVEPRSPYQTPAMLSESAYNAQKNEAAFAYIAAITEFYRLNAEAIERSIAQEREWQLSLRQVSAVGSAVRVLDSFNRRGGPYAVLRALAQGPESRGETTSEGEFSDGEGGPGGAAPPEEQVEAADVFDTLGSAGEEGEEGEEEDEDVADAAEAVELLQLVAEAGDRRDRPGSAPHGLLLAPRAEIFPLVMPDIPRRRRRRAGSAGAESKHPGKGAPNSRKDTPQPAEAAEEPGEVPWTRNGEPRTPAAVFIELQERERDRQNGWEFGISGALEEIVRARRAASAPGGPATGAAAAAGRGRARGSAGRAGESGPPGLGLSLGLGPGGAPGAGRGAVASGGRPRGASRGARRVSRGSSGRAGAGRSVGQPGRQPGLRPGLQPGMQPGIQSGRQAADPLAGTLGGPPGVSPGSPPGAPPGVSPVPPQRGPPDAPLGAPPAGRSPPPAQPGLDPPDPRDQPDPPDSLDPPDPPGPLGPRAVLEAIARARELRASPAGREAEAATREAQIREYQLALRTQLAAGRVVRRRPLDGGNPPLKPPRERLEGAMRAALTPPVGAREFQRLLDFYGTGTGAFNRQVYSFESERPEDVALARPEFFSYLESMAPDDGLGHGRAARDQGARPAGGRAGSAGRGAAFPGGAGALAGGGPGGAWGAARRRPAPPRAQSPSPLSPLVGPELHGQALARAVLLGRAVPRGSLGDLITQEHVEAALRENAVAEARALHAQEAISFRDVPTEGQTPLCKPFLAVPGHLAVRLREEDAPGLYNKAFNGWYRYAGSSALSRTSGKSVRTALASQAAALWRHTLDLELMPPRLLRGAALACARGAGPGARLAGAPAAGPPPAPPSGADPSGLLGACMGALPPEERRRLRERRDRIVDTAARLADWSIDLRRLRQLEAL